MPRTALITGAGKRAGKAIATALAKQGYALALHYHHSKEGCEGLKQDYESESQTISTHQADLSQEEDLYKLIHSVYNTHEQIDLLILNASVFKKQNLISASSENFDTHVSVHLKSSFILMQEFAKRYKNEHGQIISITDCNLKGSSPYSLSKAGLAHLSKEAAKELAPKIRVNCIAPGWIIDPEIGEAQSKLADIPLGRKPELTHIVSSIRFLEETDSITGETIHIDCGQHLC